MGGRRSGRQADASAAAAAADDGSGSELSSARSADLLEPILPSSQAQIQTGPGLQFSDALTWRAGRTIPVAELLKRLQALSTEMRSMDQQEEDDAKASLTKVAKELASEQLLSHKDRGVRAWAASCAVDVLRLCAPDAPFSERELRGVFDNVVKTVMPALSDPSNPYNTQHMYVLQSLAQIKSIVLITDLPNADSLLLHLFDTFFDTLSGSTKASTGEQVGKQVIFNMTTALVVIVDEMEQLPPDVVDSIMAQFLRVDSRVTAANGAKNKKGSNPEEGQAILEMKELPPAYIMAKTVCNSCTEKMAREVSKYFSDVIVEVTARTRERRKDAGDDLEDPTAGPSEEDVKELANAHRLMCELWRACPAVLQNVIPQLEAELGAENLRLRLLATETLGNIIAGIGAAGPPPVPVMDPAAYPPPSLSGPPDTSHIVNLLTVPAAPQSFSQTFSDTYTAYLGRGNDRSPSIRAARVTGIGRILTTSAGGVGLGNNEEKHLVEELARALNDSDEKVRLAAVRAVAGFNFRDVVSKLGLSGSVDHTGSVLANLSERVKDKKPAVREEAMTTLANIWAMATGEMAEGNDQVVQLINGASSKILNAYYTNDPELMAIIDKMLFEVLVPLRYPPIKGKAVKAVKSGSQRIEDSQAPVEADSESKTIDPDQLRAERILLLAKGLDERAKKVFLSFSSRQVNMRKYMLAYLHTCEAYNGGVIDKDDADIKSRLSRLVDTISKLLSEPSRAAQDLQKFAKLHDRRSYQLLRFCMAPESDYRTAYNAIKEFKKRVEGSAPSAALIHTLLPLIYRSSILLYNKSHVPSYLDYAKTNDKGFAGIAHEILTEISQRSPEVLKANISEICHRLQEEAPTATKPNNPNEVDSLKACAAFARKFTDEIPQDAKFVKAMQSFALHGTPPEAAKHAVTIIMAASKRKEMLAKDLVSQCVKGFEYGNSGFLSRLATLSRLSLLAPSEVDEQIEAILNIATKDILLNIRNPSDEDPDEYRWSAEVDDECTAKCWALKLLVNRVRSHKDQNTLAETSSVVYNLLNRLIEHDGEVNKAKTTPPAHKSRLRLTAARCMLKLCLSNAHNNLLEPQGFQDLALVAMDPIYNVRLGFMQRLKKYLGQNRLPVRFYVIPFLLAYEPEAAFRNETVTWIKARVSFFASQTTSTHDGDSKGGNKPPTANKALTTMESIFPRLIHLLAHHPDYDESVEGLSELARYFVFYVSAVCTSQNVSLVYHVGQRVKTCTDATVTTTATSTTQQDDTPPKTSPKKSRKSRADTTDYASRLHVLSDLATLTVRAFVEAQGWMLASLPTRLTLPRSLFAEIRDHDRSVVVATQSFLPDPEALQEEVEKLARAAARRANAQSSGSSGGAQGGAAARKRKSEAGAGAGGGEGAKRVRSSTGAGGAGAGGAKKERSYRGKAGGARKRAREWGGSEDGDGDGDEGEGGGARADKPRKRTAGEETAAAAAARRKSGRSSAARGAYRERDDDEDDEEMEDAQAEEEGVGKDKEEDSEGDGDGDDDEEDDKEDKEETGSDEEIVEKDDAPATNGRRAQPVASASSPPKARRDAHSALMAGARATKGASAPPAAAKKAAAATGARKVPERRAGARTRK